MKTIVITLLTLLCLNGFSQRTSKPAKTSQKKVHKTASSVHQALQPGRPVHNLAPGQTVTDLYLNGPANKSSNTDTANKKAGNFASGITAAPGADKPFNSPDSSNAINAGAGNTTSAAPFRNDTTYNSNTITANGLPTNSGAVDKSGQTQFGQSNWGERRGTVGEGQWTVPPPVSSSFSREFPQASKATWTRNSADSSLYSARYRSGDYWVTSNYSATGQRLDQRTEYPLLQSPQAVNSYIYKQPGDFKATSIYKVQVEGKPDMYELHTQGGKTIYITMDGTEVIN